MTATRQELSEAQKIARNARTLADTLDVLHTLGVEAPTSFDLYPWLDVPTVQWLIINEGGQKDRAAAIIRTIGGKWDKNGVSDKYFRFESVFAGSDLRIVVDRPAVCERVVVGTREVTKTVPAPDAPMVEVTETEDIIEWRCEPVLSGVTA